MTTGHNSWPLAVFEADYARGEYLYYDVTTNTVRPNASAPPRTMFLQITGGPITGALVRTHATIHPTSSELVTRSQVASRIGETYTGISSSFVRKSGGQTITSALNVHIGALNNLTVVNRGYVDGRGGQYLRMSGSTMTGHLGLPPIAEFPTDIMSRRLAAPLSWVLEQVSFIVPFVTSLTHLYKPIGDISRGPTKTNCRYPITDTTVVHKKWVEDYINCVFSQMESPSVVIDQAIQQPRGNLTTAVFSARTKIEYQDMCGGGSRGRAYPLTFAIEYLPIDTEDKAENYVRYLQNVYARTCSILETNETSSREQILAVRASDNRKLGYPYNHVRTRLNSWVRWAIDLMRLPVTPAKIKRVAVKSSGWGTKVWLADVSLTAGIADSGRVPVIGEAGLVLTIDNERNRDLTNAVSVVLNAEVMVSSQSRGCPLSAIIDYHAVTGYATAQYNWSHTQQCISSGVSQVIPKDVWTPVSIDLKSLAANAFDKITVKGRGIHFDSRMRSLELAVCRWEGGQEARPATPGIPAVPARDAIAATDGVPEQAGSTTSPVATLFTSALAHNVGATDGITAAVLTVACRVIRKDEGVCPIVVEVRYESVLGSQHHHFVGITNNAGDTSHFTNNVSVLASGVLVVDLVPATTAVSSILRFSEIRVHIIGTDTSVDLTTLTLIVQPLIGASVNVIGSPAFGPQWATVWTSQLGPYGTASHNAQTNKLTINVVVPDPVVGVNIVSKTVSMIRPPAGTLEVSMDVNIVKQLANSACPLEIRIDYKTGTFTRVSKMHSVTAMSCTGGSASKTTVTMGEWSPVSFTLPATPTVTSVDKLTLTTRGLDFEVLVDNLKIDAAQVEGGVTPSGGSCPSEIMAAIRWQLSDSQYRSVNIEARRGGFSINKTQYGDDHLIATMSNTDRDDGFTTNEALIACVTSIEPMISTWASASSGYRSYSTASDSLYWTERGEDNNIVTMSSYHYSEYSSGNDSFTNSCETAPTIERSDGLVEIAGDGGAKYCRMYYNAFGTPDGSSEDSEPVAPIPGSPDIPATPGVPAVPAVPAAPGVDPTLVCTSIVPTLCSNTWQTLAGTGTVEVSDTCEVHLSYSDTVSAPPAVCYELIRNSELDASYSAWDIQELCGTVSVQESDLVRVCDARRVTGSAMLLSTISRQDCDEVLRS